MYGAAAQLEERRGDHIRQSPQQGRVFFFLAPILCVDCWGGAARYSQTAGRDLHPDEVELRSVWIALIYLTLENANWPQKVQRAHEISAPYMVRMDVSFVYLRVWDESVTNSNRSCFLLFPFIREITPYTLRRCEGAPFFLPP